MNSAVESTSSPVPAIRASRLLATLRLAGLLGDTAASMVALVWRGLVAGPDDRRAARAAQRWASRTLRRCGVRVDVRGPLPTSPAVLVANHRSYLDIAVLLSQVPCHFLAKKELASWPVLGPAARHANTVFVDRSDGASRRGARDSLARAVAGGATVAVFPEGTTTAGPGLLPFRPGVFAMAAAQAVPIIPVAVWYDRPEVAWVGDDEFVPHFLECFSERTTIAHVSFGPQASHVEPMELCRSTWSWIARCLSECGQPNARRMQ